MTLATAEPPRSTRQMTADEAKEITEAIRGNFDSLGKMLVEVRERKGYLALGYKSLETYCLTEFGKGKSRVYQLMEEFKIEEEIIEELATSDSPIKSLKMPGTLLRQLRELESPRQRIEAIAYANQLAENDGKRKATKTHLQVAVHKISGGNKSEQTRQIITKEMGFDKGVEVEVVEGYSRCMRGVIRKVDTKGQVHVELYNGNSMPIAWDVSNLRIVSPAEKPQIPTTIDTVNIGDKVRIFSSTSNKLKIGEIVARINDKQALVQIKEGHKIEIPYAELEKITENKTEQKVQDWENDLIWAASWNELPSWYYNAEQREIKSFPCPGITFQIEENTKFANPSDWLENWRNKYGSSLADVLLTPDDIATLVMATAIKMSDTEKQEFLARINVLITIPATLPLEFEQTTEFLVEDAASATPALEPEQTAEFLVEDAASATPALEPEQTAEFLVEDTASATPALEPEQTAEFLVEDTASASPLESQASWLEVLDSNSFTQGYIQLGQLAEEPIESYRGWDIYTYDSSVADISHPVKGIFSIDFSWTFEKEIIKPLEWLKNIINQVEDFCPGQLSLFEEPSTTEKSNPNWKKEWLASNFPVRPEIGYSVTQGFLGKKIADKLESLLDEADTLVSKLNSKKIKRAELIKIEKAIKQTRQSIKDLEFFGNLQIGMLVSHRHANKIGVGIITNLTLSTGGMPEAWVKWEELSIEIPEKLSLINIQDEKEEES